MIHDLKLIHLRIGGVYSANTWHTVHVCLDDRLDNWSQLMDVQRETQQLYFISKTYF